MTEGEDWLVLRAGRERRNLRTFELVVEHTCNDVPFGWSPVPKSDCFSSADRSRSA